VIYVERTDQGYQAFISGDRIRPEWISDTGLTANGVVDALISKGIDPREAVTKVRSADEAFELGTQDQLATIRSMRLRAEAGGLSVADVDYLRRELMDNKSHLDKGALVATLGVAGASPKTEAVLSEVVETVDDPGAVHIALTWLANWGSASFVPLAMAILARPEPVNVPGLHGLVMSLVPSLATKGRVEPLFDEIVRIASDPEAAAVDRKDARVTIATIAGGTPLIDPARIVETSDAEFNEIVTRARSRL
jgi:hypothetical protein